MFALIESGSTVHRGSDWAPRVTSFALHTALIAAAVFATQRAVTLAPPLIIERVVPPWQAAPPKPDLPVASGATTTTPLPGVPLPSMPLTIPPDIPAPGPGETLPGPIGDPAPGPFSLNATPGGVPLGGRAPLDARVVEEQPVMLTHPAINYPEVLRQAGIEGRVLVEAVLDTLGRAEPGSLRVTASPNPMFDREALAVVLGSRYRPGRAEGRAVRVRIQVPVSFTIRR